MPVLTNSRHEAFAQAIAKGASAVDAYVQAGYAPSRSAASRLSTNVNIERRVAELINRGADRAEVTVARVLQELSRIGFSDLRRAFDKSGRLLRPEEWDDDTAAAIASVEVVTRNIGDGEVEHVHKIKVWDKNSALEKIAKHLGMFIERVEHSGGMSLNVTSEDAEL
ncbi:terminase small subunit [Rhizobium alvei]|uniref:Terminase small subunit n=1 Tax=Rhizobium alvei TaxID=1132659 RepID=A0ABT8YT79_9HYPH|nr:terminase small subunit [Rhizobium alvei]MDO6966972.1 terminase small subunit [Rhizobium alvei]